MAAKPEAAEPEFDAYDGNYQSLVEESMGFSGMSHDYVTRVKADLIVELLRTQFGQLEGLTVLDVGCGVGLTDAHLARQPWHLWGADVSGKSIEQARQNNPTVRYEVATEDRLPFEDASFDACFTICVMHHVPPEGWVNFLGEMRRILRPGGLAMVLEHNPYNPLTRLVVNRCPFDEHAVLLSRGTLRARLEAARLKPLSSRFFLFTPWERLRRLDALLGWLPMGAQYVMTAEPASQ
jgi:SAM-dependent methyltransferase